MDMMHITRQLHPKETSVLEKLKTKTEKELNEKTRIPYFIFAGLLGIGFTYFASMLKIHFLAFVFGAIALFSFGFVVFMPYELYKNKLRVKKRINSIDNFLENDNLRVIPVNALRIALAKENEDEGDLYIIEYEIDKVLYLWDYDYNLRKEFPCLNFEIYEDGFFKLTGKQVYPLSETIQPVIIDKDAKWEYMKKMGVPGHLETENINFEKLIEKIKNIV